ncbi:hypothetical protein [Ovoidimarina sediminis]|uniref:hypothetical protein n=1 Tax=Ovoidimarina sediminis TaxID=3079856 RepID=UPI002910582D|nr:hypothetical protein [Rhodophyticola sp. MJ-SS7]MDU8942712.1 hypothetical protein [Rhodophyticola sp. MJ-SS7]
MIIQFVQFETALSHDDAIAACHDRFAAYEAFPGLIQKYYLKLSKPNHYGGIMVWETPEALARFRDSDLAKTIASAYEVVGAPEIDLHEVMFTLRGTGAPKQAEHAG